MKVVIIGAGVAGLAIGWRLRQAGAEVTILERTQPARGATWAAAGMIAVAGEMGSADTPEAAFGRHASALWPDFAREIESIVGRDIGYRRSGALMVGRSEAEWNVLAAKSTLERLGPDEARAREPLLAPGIAGALWAPDEAQVDSRMLGLALADAFVATGGTLSLNEPAVRFEVHDGCIAWLATATRRHEADVFIVAAGAWSSGIGGLPPDVFPSIRPVKGEMIAVRPPEGAVLPKQVVWGNGIYLVPRSDRLLIGATVKDAGFDTAVTDAAANWLSSHAIALMPALSKWDVVERWAGLRPGSPDNRPILGPTPIARLFVATGQYRNGILFAPAIAETMSRLVLEQASPIPAFDPRRFA